MISSEDITRGDHSLGQIYLVKTSSGEVGGIPKRRSMTGNRSLGLEYSYDLCIKLTLSIIGLCIKALNIHDGSIDYWEHVYG